MKNKSYKSRVFFNCIFCGVEDYTIKSQIKRYKGSGRFCSKECKKNYYRADPRNHPCFRGARTITTNGYVISTVKSGKQDYEHRIVAEKIIGRKLLKSEVVHHINGNKKDNRMENLEVLNDTTHRKMHRSEQISKRNKLLSLREDAPLPQASIRDEGEEGRANR